MKGHELADFIVDAIERVGDGHTIEGQMQISEETYHAFLVSVMAFVTTNYKVGYQRKAMLDIWDIYHRKGRRYIEDCDYIDE